MTLAQINGEFDIPMTTLWHWAKNNHDSIIMEKKIHTYQEEHKFGNKQAV